MWDLTLIIVPLTIIPWVALLVASTAARFNVVAGEINKLYSSDEISSNYIIEKQLLRSRLFTNVLFCLYLSLFFLFLSSFIGIAYTAFIWIVDNFIPIIILFWTGIFFTLIAIIFLMIESFTVRKVIRKKIQYIKTKQK